MAELHRLVVVKLEIIGGWRNQERFALNKEFNIRRHRLECLMFRGTVD